MTDKKRDELAEAAEAIGMKRREVVRVTQAAGGGRDVLTFDGNVVHLADDGTTNPAGRVSDAELAEARRQAEDPQGPAEASRQAPAKAAAAKK